MANPIDVIGIGADGPTGLRPELIERIHAADFLAGGERHLGYFSEVKCERFFLKKNLEELLKALYEHREAHCVVLASGDPLFYGIASYLLLKGPKNLRIEPAVSSMQLAFARAGISWESASLGSIHGRDLRETLLPMLGHARIGLFTQDGDSPAAVASFFIERDRDDYEAFVGENLGGPDERFTHWRDLNDLRHQRFAPLNYLILRWIWTSYDDEGRIQRDQFGRGVRRDCYGVSLFRSMVPGIPDDCFIRPTEGPEVMTRQEVRSVVLGKLHLRLETGDVVWDIGSGLGTVAIEVAVLRPDVEVVAVEADPVRAKFLRENRERFGAWNVRVIEGKAPEALAGEALSPSRVFIGGSGGNLAAILDLVRERLPIHANVVANFVTLEHLQLAMERLKSWDWGYTVTELHVSHSDSLARLTSLKPQRPVFILDAQKPDPEVRGD